MSVQAVRVVGTPIQISTTFINICQRKRSEPQNVMELEVNEVYTLLIILPTHRLSCRMNPVWHWRHWSFSGPPQALQCSEQFWPKIRWKRATQSTADRKNIREGDITLHSLVQPSGWVLLTSLTGMEKSDDLKHRNLLEDKKVNFTFKYQQELLTILRVWSFIWSN